MIRPLIFCTLLGASTIVLAQPLYKWVEADGSITFSLSPPPNGVDYETVNPASSMNGDTINASSSNDSTSTTGDSISAEQVPGMQQILPATNSTDTARQVAPQLGVQADSQQNNQAESLAPLNSRPLQATQNVIGSIPNNSQGSQDQRAALSAKNRKQRQCDDLQKRVISLERRLKTRLTPDDMDNTVVHMARYQRSYDHHCLR